MPVLARKVTRAKWEQKPELAPGEIAADAITVDLRTTGNTLSFWRCDSGAERDLKRAALALAAAADRLDKMDVVYLDEPAVTLASLAARDTPGDTPVASLREHHVDIEKLDYVRLGSVATLVFEALARKEALTLTQKTVRGLLVDAVRSQLISLEDLKEKVRAEVSAALST